MPDLERIGQLTPGSLSQQWYEDGSAVDPGTVTVGITRADGTVLVAAGTATTGTGTAARHTT
jgi:20S proteasome alpha/beta subunit